MKYVIYLHLQETTSRQFTFLNLYVTLSGIHGSICWMNFVSLRLFCKLSFLLLDFDLLEKKPFSKTVTFAQ